MAVDLAVALVALTASTMVQRLIAGGQLNQQDWAGFAAGVAEALITHAGRTIARDYGPALVNIERQIAAIPDREYRQHMAAGRRFLQDLPVAWRTASDRADIIRDARAEFIRASAIASESRAVHQAVLAEVAIAGCWLWVPSVLDTQRTLNEARHKLERDLAFRATGFVGMAGPHTVRDYIDVLKLCRSCAAVPTHWSIPVDPDEVPAIDAVLTVKANSDEWSYCRGIWARAGKASVTLTGTTSAVEVHNEQWDRVEVWLGARTPSELTTSDVRYLNKGARLNATLRTPVRGPVAIKIRKGATPLGKPMVAFLVPGAAPAVALTRANAFRDWGQPQR